MQFKNFKRKTIHETFYKYLKHRTVIKFYEEVYQKLFLVTMMKNNKNTLN